METLGELIQSFQLYAVCEPCQRVREVDVATLIERHGAQLPIQDVRGRLRCTACGARTGGVRIVYVGPCRRAASFRYTR